MHVLHAPRFFKHKESKEVIGHLTYFDLDNEHRADFDECDVTGELLSDIEQKEKEILGNLPALDLDEIERVATLKGDEALQWLKILYEKYGIAYESEIENGKEKLIIDTYNPEIANPELRESCRILDKQLAWSGSLTPTQDGGTKACMYVTVKGDENAPEYTEAKPEDFDGAGNNVSGLL